MLEDGRGILVALLMVVLLTPLMGGSSCQPQVNDVLEVVRDVHMGVREAGVLADEQIAPMLENRGETCIARAEAAGFPANSGLEGMEYWRDCMTTYFQLETAVTGMRTTLEELENVYSDIESGVRGETDWRYWAARVLDHGRTILRLVRELDIGIDSDVLRGMQTNLDSLCGMLGCDAEATS